MKIDFDRSNGGVKVIVQDVDTHDVLMFAYMNEEAYDITLDTKELTFFSIENQELWTKGEKKNALLLHTVEVDSKGEALLIKAEPSQPIGEDGRMTNWDDTFSNQYGLSNNWRKI